MSTTPSKSAPSKGANLRKLPFTHGMEVENFLTNRNGDILEDGKELVAVWDQMFNGALNFFKSLTSTTTNVPAYIRKKIKRVTRKDVERHGKTIRYVQLTYQVNGEAIAINIFGPDPNISQITWLLELVTPPCEYIEELDWWINTLYTAAAKSITKGYMIQPLGFNPYQTEYRAGVTCGEHHHLGGFKTAKEKKAVYNMIRAYIPHLIAMSNTSPFIDRKPSGRTLLKKGSDGRTLILAPDCVRSFRLKENSGQLGPNIPEYLPHVSASFTRQQFSRYVRKEIPDDRYVDVFPFTDYGTIEMRFFDAQFDQRIRIAIIILLQALALKGVNIVRSGAIIPEVKGNTLYEHRKRAVNFGMFAKFQGDPSIESVGGDFVKYYNHNPDTGGAPGKIYESLRSLLIWLKPELMALKVREEDLAPVLIMLWGTSRIAPPISPATFMFYLFEQNHSNIASVIKGLSLLNGKPRKTFCELLGRPSNSLQEFLQIKAAAPKRTKDNTRSSLARGLQQDSRTRRKKVMAQERARLKAKQAQTARIQREKVKQEKELERKRKERLAKLEKSKRPPPKPSATQARGSLSKRAITPYKPPASKKAISKRAPSKSRTTTSRTSASRKRAPPSRTVPKFKSSTSKPPTRKPTSSKTKSKPKTSVKASSKRKPPAKRKAPTKKKTTTKKKAPTKSKKVISSSAIKSKKTTPTRKPAQAYASTASTNRRYSSRQIVVPKPNITKRTTKTTTTRKKTTTKRATSTVKTTTSAALTMEAYRDTKFIRSVSIVNFPSRVDYGIILPVVRVRWKRSILQSMVSLPVSVEAEVSSTKSSSSFQKTAFLEKVTLERASLLDGCNLAIPINIGKAKGDFQVKFIVRNQKSRKVIATDYRTFTRSGVSKDRSSRIKKLSIPRNQAGESIVNIQVETPKKGTRGKITLFGVSQRGIVRLYEKKAKFKTTTFTHDLPVLIPLSMCSSNWFVYAIFNARGSNTSAITKATAPLSKLINLNLSGNPPLRLRVRDNFTSELTPKMSFKAKCEIHEVTIMQVEGSSRRVLKRYRMKTRINKGEKFVLEAFSWKAPTIRRGLFKSAKQKTIRFNCIIKDSVGRVDDSLIGIVETPTMTVYRKS